MREYQYLICPFVTLIICQLIKFTIESIQKHKMNFGRLLNGTGGMPSSHTSFSSSITMLIGYNLGFSSPIFAVALIFTLITAYDAMGLRYESGKQAEAINMLFDELGNSIKKPKVVYKKLKEQLGHKPLEVLVGFLLGTIVSLCFYISM